MRDRPRVSLLLPNYNNGPILRTCLDKLVRHTTYPDVELIVADDGSTDDGVEILRRFGETQPFSRFTLLEREHGDGFVTRLNEMLEYATGEVIVKIDGDATVETPGWVERMLGFLRCDDRIGIAQAKVIFDSGRVHTYRVTFTTIVSNTQLWPLGGLGVPSLTLQTCWTWDGTRDFIVRAVQI